MSYLPKEQRRAQIVEAAVALLAKEGLSAVTVRGVAACMDASPGQIHHHFASADALRAEALRAFGSRSLRRVMQKTADWPPGERVLALLADDAKDEDPICDRIWRDATEASRMDRLIREAVTATLDEWLDCLCERLAELPETRGARATDLRRIARRLMAASIGRDVLQDFDRGCDDPGAELRRLLGLELRDMTPAEA